MYIYIYRLISVFQVFAQHPMHMAPQSVMSPYPASKAGMIPQSHLVATAGLYQGASLAYPQPNVSPAGAMPTRMTLPSNPYAVQAVQVPCPAGRSVSPYAAGSPQLAAMPAGAIPAGAIPTSSAYPGTFISGYTFAGYPNANNPHYSTASIMQQPPQNYSTISVAAAQSAGPPQPIQQQQQPAHTQQFTMSMSNLSTPHQPTHHQPQQSFDPGPTNTILVAQHPRPQMVRTGHPQQMQAMSAAFPQNPAVPQGVPGASASGLPSYPPGVMAASPPGAHHIPGLSPAMGAPLVANPTFPGAAPYPRGLP